MWEGAPLDDGAKFYMIESGRVDCFRTFEVCSWAGLGAAGWAALQLCSGGVQRLPIQSLPWLQIPSVFASFSSPPKSSLPANAPAGTEASGEGPAGGRCIRRGEWALMHLRLRSARFACSAPAFSKDCVPPLAASVHHAACCPAASFYTDAGVRHGNRLCCPCTAGGSADQSSPPGRLCGRHPVSLCLLLSRAMGCRQLLLRTLQALWCSCCCSPRSCCC